VYEKVNSLFDYVTHQICGVILQNMLYCIVEIQLSLSKLTDESERIQENPDLQSVCFTPVKTSSLLLRFGHSSIRFHGNKSLLTVGGFGEQGGKHRRLIDIAITDLETMETTIILPDVDPKVVEGKMLHKKVNTFFPYIVLECHHHNSCVISNVIMIIILFIYFLNIFIYDNHVYLSDNEDRTILKLSFLFL